jgi:hypothetical protein
VLGATMGLVTHVWCDYGVGHTCLLIVGSVPSYTSNQHLQYCHKNLHQCSPVLPAGSGRCPSRWALLAHCGCNHALLVGQPRRIAGWRESTYYRVISLGILVECDVPPRPAARFTQPGRWESVSAGNLFPVIKLRRATWGARMATILHC